MTRDDLVLGVAIRAGTLGLAVVSATDVIEVRRHVLLHACRQDDRRLAHLILALAADYGVRRIVADFDLPPAVARTRAVMKIDLRAAKAAILGTGQARPWTAAELFHHLVGAFPKVANVVTVLRTGRVAMTDRRQTVVLLAVALGLVAARRGRSLNLT